ncbi:putative D,D-dipeptide transport system permease protein DdpC [Pelotomaculum schinkii]|uniref:Putative D,D-dipeptide transport system permease protein DdpC n=1 Tax=Pelotomaculum schinkii TaxID=78350 RepID=A0A4Y7RI62_9FIRM|nr:nickel transporter permease [Pelotomaculum schinkii]TEB08392.1 putative D,D-dipeptide transport system permease protein DdpC [Pelotomaculum schinkii]
MKCAHSNSLNRIYLFLGAGFAFFIFFIQVILPALAPHDPNAVNVPVALQQPCAAYPFGTDRLGRCVMSRVLYGASTSLITTFTLVFIAVILGSVIGLISGYAGGLADSCIMRVTDVFLAFPNLVLAIAVAGVLGPGLFNTGIAIISTGWTKYARLTRGLIIMEKNKNYVIAAKLSGAGVSKIIVKYLLPNVVSQIIVIAAVDIGGFLLSVASLSFLGLGAQPPTSEWGYMLYEGKSMLQQAPWLTIFPGISIFITVCLFNFLGDFLRDLFDPKEQSSIPDRF